jgi:hypothetical protein
MKKWAVKVTGEVIYVNAESYSSSTGALVFVLDGEIVAMFAQGYWLSVMELK